MHLTASVIIQDEESESGPHRDIVEWVEQLAPEDPHYRHHQTGEDNGDAHLKNLLLHHQVIVAFTEGRLDLGPNQTVLFIELDGLRPKRILVKVMGE